MAHTVLACAIAGDDCQPGGLPAPARRAILGR
jgi:hypothetical protein